MGVDPVEPGSFADCPENDCYFDERGSNENPSIIGVVSISAGDNCGENLTPKVAWRIVDTLWGYFIWVTLRREKREKALNIKCLGF